MHFLENTNTFLLCLPKGRWSALSCARTFLPPAYLFFSGRLHEFLVQKSWFNKVRLTSEYMFCKISLHPCCFKVHLTDNQDGKARQQPWANKFQWQRADVLAWCPSLRQDTEDFGAHEGRKQHFSTTVTYKCTPFSFMPILPHSLSVAQLEQSPDVELTGTLANFSKLPKHTKLFCISRSALALPGMTPPSPTFPGLQILTYLSKSSPGTTPHDPFHTPLHCRGMNSLAVSFLLLRL